MTTFETEMMDNLLVLVKELREKIAVLEERNAWQKRTLEQVSDSLFEQTAIVRRVKGALS